MNDKLIMSIHPDFDPPIINKARARENLNDSDSKEEGQSATDEPDGDSEGLSTTYKLSYGASEQRKRYLPIWIGASSIALLDRSSC